MHLAPREPSPLLALTVADIVDDLDALLKRVLTGVSYPGIAINTLGLTALQAERLHTKIPNLIRELRNLAALQAESDPTELNVIRRIADKCQPDGMGCLRWHGSAQGAHKWKSEGGTPVISYRGQTVPARRLMWQIKYPAGHPEHLGEDERLRNSDDCHVGSRCMNMDHWHRTIPEKTVRNDRALARDIQRRIQSRDPGLTRTVLATHPELLTTTRVCRNGHLVDAGGGPGQRQGHRDCPICRKQAPSRKLAARAAVRHFDALMNPRKPAIATRSQPQLPSPSLAALAADLDFSGLLPTPPTKLTFEEELKIALDTLTEEEFEVWAEAHTSPESDVAGLQSPPAALEAPSTPPWPAEWADEPEEKIDPAVVMALLDPKGNRL